MPDTAALTQALLPPNRTALESAVVHAVHAVGHDERTIPRASLPYETPQAILPWLAWSRDVLAWPRAGDATLQRNITARSWHLHRNMGTLAGFREVAGYYGASISKAITPPSKSYAGSSLTRSERNAFLQRYPELRIHYQRTTSQRVGAMLHRLYAGQRIYPVQTDAALRLAPQAFLVRDGHESPLQSTQRTLTTTRHNAIQYTEVRRAGTAGHQTFCGRHPLWLVAGDAASRMYRLGTDTPYMHSSETLRQTNVTAGLEPMAVAYDWATLPGQAQGVHAAQFVRGHLVRSTAKHRIYKRWWLFDPAVALERRNAQSFCSGSILGMPAHHAQLHLRMRGHAHARQATRYVAGCLVAHDLQDYRDTLTAMANVTRASDRVSIQTANHDQITATESLRAGSVHAGQWRTRT